MDIREIIRKAKETAKNPDELLLAERFEEYLDLLELRMQATQSEMVEIQIRLQRTQHSLQEAANRVAASYGIDPQSLFRTLQNIGIELKPAVHKPREAPMGRRKRSKRNLKV